MGGNRRKGHRTRAQHYVPQFYLRGFTGASGKMFCYDKASGNVYPTSPHDAAHQANFYEIAPGTTKSPVADNTVEKFLSRLEREFAPMLARLIRSADTDTIFPELLDYFSPYVALQWLRTKTFRDTIHQTCEKFMQAHAYDLIRANFPGQEAKVRVTVGTETMPALQAQFMLDPEAILGMTEALDHHTWVVGINRTGHLFYTSDHPVGRRANCCEGGRRLLGARDPGIEYVYPLDSRHILLILERSYFRTWRRHDGRAVQLSTGQVEDYNGLQVRLSGQRLFCAEDDFDLARKLCAAEPEIRDPNRPRVKVETTAMVDAGDTKKNYVITTALE